MGIEWREVQEYIDLLIDKGTPVRMSWLQKDFEERGYSVTKPMKRAIKEYVIGKGYVRDTDRSTATPMIFYKP